LVGTVKFQPAKKVWAYQWLRKEEKKDPTARKLAAQEIAVSMKKKGKKNTQKITHRNHSQGKPGWNV